MRCSKTRKNISLALDGVLPPEETRALEEHLTACADCRAHRDDLLLGSRLLKATAAVPSEAFEWKLQLKLNRALQEAAAARTPWEDAAPQPRFGWLRGFTLSAGAGLAVTVAMALWLFPHGAAQVDQGPAPAAVVAAVESPATADASAGVSTTAGDADRRSLATSFRPLVGLERGLGGSLVSSGGVFRNDAGPAWSRGVTGRNLSTLQAEISWLRDRLRASQADNDSLRALLADRPVSYFEQEKAPRH